MVIDDTFMMLYWLYKVGKTCTVLAVILAGFVLTMAVGGCSCYLQPDLELYKKDIKVGKMMLNSLWVSVPALMLCLLVAGITPSKDELKAYAAYRIGEKVVTSDEADRLMNAALLYLEGKASEVNRQY